MVNSFLFLRKSATESEEMLSFFGTRLNTKQRERCDFLFPFFANRACITPCLFSKTE